MMPRMKKYITHNAQASIRIRPVTAGGLRALLNKEENSFCRWVQRAGFAAKPGTHCIVPDKNNFIQCVLMGVNETPDIWSFAALPALLKEGMCAIEGKYTPAQLEQFALGWQLGTYQFTRYKKSEKTFATLSLPKSCDLRLVGQMAESIFLVRDMINTPANHMTPAAIAGECRKIARESGASCKVIEGDDLLKANYPAIHAVGRASVNAPCLIDMRWGKKTAPRITLVGKGVCFDSGGLDIKSASGMKLMKKDMGGAATALGLARMIMLSRLPVQLRVLIPAVENSIDGNAFRPSDIITTRKGITVEVGNTDAEGRLILCDALAEADSETPEVLIDFATLTGAARVALGPDLPAYFTDSEELANAVDTYSKKMADPLWRLPLWTPYRETLNTNIADINSAPDNPYAGAITAALYLKEFVNHAKRWMHIDLMAWNPAVQPGRPVGGEAMTLRALYALIENYPFKK